MGEIILRVLFFLWEVICTVVLHVLDGRIRRSAESVRAMALRGGAGPGIAAIVAAMTRGTFALGLLLAVGLVLFSPLLVALSFAKG